MKSPKEFVLDGSVTMAWYFKDEMNDYANAVRDGLDRTKLSSRPCGRSRSRTPS